MAVSFKVGVTVPVFWRLCINSVSQFSGICRLKSETQAAILASPETPHSTFKHPRAQQTLAILVKQIYSCRAHDTEQKDLFDGFYGTNC